MKKPRPWTDDEAIDLAYWAHEGERPAEVARRLRRTKLAVSMKAHKLGVRFGYPKDAKAPVRRIPEPRRAPGLLPMVRSALPREVSDREARAVAIYIAHVELEMTRADAAAAVGLQLDAVRYWTPKIEDRRDDPEFDSLIDQLTERAREIAA